MLHQIEPPSDGGPGLLLLGIDHRCAPLEMREKVAYDQGESEELLVHLIAHEAIAEAFLLSTCNRTEVYLRPRDEEKAQRLGLERVFLRSAPELEGRLSVKRGTKALRHLFSVAAGLESMVLGESEVLGQIKRAATLAEALSASGPLLRRVLQSALATGKRARNETGIGSGSVSAGSAAVALVRKIVPGFEQRPILLLGAGETATAVARSLSAAGATRLTVANRSRERAQRLQETVPVVQLLSFGNRREALVGCDLVIAATTAAEPVLTRRDLEEAVRHRTSRRLVVMDLSVPRSIDPKAGGLPNLLLHDLDSLQHLIDGNLRRRREEVPKVCLIVEEEIDRFLSWCRGVAAEPVVARLQKQAEEIRRREVAAALGGFPPDTHAALEHLTRSLVRKLLHHPSARLRASEASGPHLDLVRDLFQLDAERGQGGESEERSPRCPGP